LRRHFPLGVKSLKRMGGNGDRQHRIGWERPKLALFHKQICPAILLAPLLNILVKDFRHYYDSSSSLEEKVCQIITFVNLLKTVPYKPLEKMKLPSQRL
jgi:hypothetical protein